MLVFATGAICCRQVQGIQSSFSHPTARGIAMCLGPRHGPPWAARSRYPSGSRFAQLAFLPHVMCPVSFSLRFEACDLKQPAGVLHCDYCHVCNCEIDSHVVFTSFLCHKLPSHQSKWKTHIERSWEIALHVYADNAVVTWFVLTVLTTFCLHHQVFPSQASLAGIIIVLGWTNVSAPRQQGRTRMD